MNYFKNTELAKIYNVSEKSVRNWVQATQDGKLGLQLFQKGDKFFIANTSKNTVMIEELVQKGKKYKNKRGFKMVSPTPEFYKIYNSKQIFDIISSLTIHHELPLKYGYINGGADYWDTYAQRLLDEESPNILNSTIELLKSNLNHLDHLLSSGRPINVVDLGPGNCLATRVILTYLIEQKRLNRYVAIDISDDILRIAKSNLRRWFGDAVNFEGYVRDLEYEQFDDLFAQDYAGADANRPLNLVLGLGGTICNFRSPDRALLAINNSLGLDDLFTYSMKLDTPNARRHFDFSVTTEHQEISPRHKLVADLLNVDESLCTAEQVFDEARQTRSIALRPRVDLSIKFDLTNGTRVVDLRKDEPILLWQAWHWSALDVIKRFDRNGFDLIQASKTKDQEYLLLTSKIKSGRSL